MKLLLAFRLASFLLALLSSAVNADTPRVIKTHITTKQITVDKHHEQDPTFPRFGHIKARYASPGPSTNATYSLNGTAAAGNCSDWRFSNGTYGPTALGTGHACRNSSKLIGSHTHSKISSSKCHTTSSLDASLSQTAAESVGDASSTTSSSVSETSSSTSSVSYLSSSALASTPASKTDPGKHSALDLSSNSHGVTRSASPGTRYPNTTSTSTHSSETYTTGTTDLSPATLESQSNISLSSSVTSEPSTKAPQVHSTDLGEPGTLDPSTNTHEVTHSSSPGTRLPNITSTKTYLSESSSGETADVTPASSESQTSMPPSNSFADTVSQTSNSETGRHTMLGSSSTTSVVPNTDSIKHTTLVSSPSALETTRSVSLGPSFPNTISSKLEISDTSSSRLDGSATGVHPSRQSSVLSTGDVTRQSSTASSEAPTGTLESSSTTHETKKSVSTGTRFPNSTSTIPSLSITASVGPDGSVVPVHTSSQSSASSGSDVTHQSSIANSETRSSVTRSPNAISTNLDPSDTPSARLDGSATESHTSRQSSVLSTGGLTDQSTTVSSETRSLTGAGSMFTTSRGSYHSTSDGVRSQTSSTTTVDSNHSSSTINSENGSITGAGSLTTTSRRFDNSTSGSTKSQTSLSATISTSHSPLTTSSRTESMSEPTPTSTTRKPLSNSTTSVPEDSLSIPSMGNVTRHSSGTSSEADSMTESATVPTDTQESNGFKTASSRKGSMTGPPPASLTSKGANNTTVSMPNDSSNLPSTGNFTRPSTTRSEGDSRTGFVSTPSDSRTNLFTAPSDSRTNLFSTPSDSGTAIFSTPSNTHATRSTEKASNHPSITSLATLPDGAGSSGATDSTASNSSWSWPTLLDEITIQTGDWEEAATSASCKPPCTLTLPALSFDKPATLSYPDVTSSVCIVMSGVMYSYVTAVKIAPVTVTEMSLKPLPVPSMISGAPSATFTAAPLYPAPSCGFWMPPGDGCPALEHPESKDGICGIANGKSCPDMQCCSSDGKW